jgi:hypothetical protein
MKKLFRFIMIGALITGMACKKDEDNKPTNPGSTLVELSGDLTTRTLTADKKYLIKGQVFVRSGQTLTIEPGTIIFGDKRTRGTLIIDKGGMLMAEGTADKPIVFTSNQEAGTRDRGDWGGIVILGTAQTNQPVSANTPAIEGITPVVTFGSNGTANNEQSSGKLKYVRIEFAGIELTPNNETNSLTMGGVGKGTQADYIQVSFGGDDGFEWYGGVSNHKYLISFATWDDDYDVDFGYGGNVQFGLAIRYPGFADQSESNGFECDNGPDDENLTPYTTGTFSNMTIIGPISPKSSGGNRVSNNNYRHAIDLRRRTAVTIANSIFAGFPRGLRMNQLSVYQQYTVNNNGALINNTLLTPTGHSSNVPFAAGFGTASETTPQVKDYWTANNRLREQPMSDTLLINNGIRPEWFFDPTALSNQYPANPNFTATNTGAASFTHPKFEEPSRSSFFDKNVTFCGAFGNQDWTDGWAEFNPVDKEY